MWRPEHSALLGSRMVGHLQDAHNECSAPALMVKPPKALHVAVVEDDPRIQQLISAEITDEGRRPCARTSRDHARCMGERIFMGTTIF